MPHRIMTLGKVRMNTAISVFLLSAAIAVPSAAVAETRYVTDVGHYVVRESADPGSPVVGTLASGEAVEVLSGDADGKVVHVRLPDGKTGYTQSRFLMDKPAARARVAELEKKLASLSADPKSGAAQLKQLQEERDGLKQALDEAQRNLSGARTELQQLRQASADPVAVGKERDALRTQLATLQKETEQLRGDAQERTSDEERMWFMVGGAVALGGVLLGLILPYLRLRQRRGSWWSSDISIP
jgi:SH3 domain protein